MFFKNTQWLTYADEVQLDRKKRQKTHEIQERVNNGPLARWIDA